MCRSGAAWLQHASVVAEALRNGGACKRFGCSSAESQLRVVLPLRAGCVAAGTRRGCGARRFARWLQRGRRCGVVVVAAKAQPRRAAKTGVRRAPCVAGCAVGTRRLLSSCARVRFRLLFGPPCATGHACPNRTGVGWAAPGAPPPALQRRKTALDFAPAPRVLPPGGTVVVQENGRARRTRTYSHRVFSFRRCNSRRVTSCNKA